jgi:hypothetical protein
MGNVPNPISPVDVAAVGSGVLTETRRRFLKYISSIFTSSVVPKMFSHAVAGGAGYGSKSLPWFHELSKKDFTTEKDESKVRVSRSGPAELEFEVQRNYTLKANRSGSFTFEQPNPGVFWKAGDCTLEYEDTIHKLSIDPPDPENKGYGTARGPKIHVSPDKPVIMQLVSIERYPATRGFYSLKIGGYIPDSIVSWCPATDDLRTSLGIEGRVYSESTNAMLETLGASVSRRKSHLTEGVNILLTWRG